MQKLKNILYCQSIFIFKIIYKLIIYATIKNILCINLKIKLQIYIHAKSMFDIKKNP